jgi:hypothetical protein
MTGEMAFDDETAIATIETFIIHLWSGTREPARFYIEESTLPLILAMASDGSYARAMRSPDDMNEFVELLSDRFAAAADMDW